jgi:hypothetical protein
MRPTLSSERPHVRGLPYFDADSLLHPRAEFIHEARSLVPGVERNQKRQIARSLKRLADIQDQALRDSTPRLPIFSIVEQ